MKLCTIILHRFQQDHARVDRKPRLGNVHPVSLPPLVAQLHSGRICDALFNAVGAHRDQKIQNMNINEHNIKNLSDLLNVAHIGRQISVLANYMKLPMVSIIVKVNVPGQTGTANWNFNFSPSKLCGIQLWKAFPLKAFSCKSAVP